MVRVVSSTVRFWFAEVIDFVARCMCSLESVWLETTRLISHGFNPNREISTRLDLLFPSPVVLVQAVSSEACGRLSVGWAGTCRK